MLDGKLGADEAAREAEKLQTRLHIFFVRLTAKGVPKDVTVEEVTRRIEAAVRYGYARRSISERSGFDVQLDVLPERLSAAIEQLT